MEKGFTDTQKEQVKKAGEKQKIVLRLLQGEKLKEVLKSVGKELSYCAETWSRIKKKYQKKGFLGLIDSRGREGGYKVKDEMINYIKREKEDNPDITGEEIKERIKTRSGETVTRRWIQSILQRLKLNNLRGRPKKENHYDAAKGQPVDHAGCWFLKGADYNMAGTKTITKIIEQK
ncbi:MAG: helix-turn-helix domain containing protein, partial [bacterium]